MYVFNNEQETNMAAAISYDEYSIAIKAIIKYWKRKLRTYLKVSFHILILAFCLLYLMLGSWIPIAIYITYWFLFSIFYDDTKPYQPNELVLNWKVKRRLQKYGFICFFTASFGWFFIPIIINRL